MLARLLEAEIEHRAAMGCERLTVKAMDERFRALGYRLDRSLDCRSMARYVSDGRTYPCLDTGVKEVDTGLSAFNFDARRDANFQAMQRLRQDVFAVVGGWILEA